MSASIGGPCQMWSIGCLLASERAYGIHCVWGTPPRLFSLKLFRLWGSPCFSLQKLWDLEMYHLQWWVQQGGGGQRGTQGDRVRRSNFQVVCVWVCLHGKPEDGRRFVSDCTIHTIMCRPLPVVLVTSLSMTYYLLTAFTTWTTRLLFLASSVLLTKYVIQSSHLPQVQLHPEVSL